MQTQTTLSGNSTKIEIKNYKHYENSVGNNLKTIQITPKYRYHMMRKEKIKIFCKVAIEEACKRHSIEMIILRVLPNHVHMIVNCPRTLSDAMLMQIIKGLSSYILSRLCPALRKRYSKGHFWSEGYFCEGCGSDFERALKYVENQELHHGFA